MKTVRKFLVTLVSSALMVGAFAAEPQHGVKKTKIVPASNKKAVVSKADPVKKSAKKVTPVAKPVVAPAKTKVVAPRADKIKPVERANKPAKSAARIRHAAAEPTAPSYRHHEASPDLKSSSFLVVDQTTGEVLLEKNAGQVVPIASITKLMTAMVVLDAQLGLHERMTIDQEDVDTLRGSRSRLPVGTELSREEMMRLALMSSENRAASSLSRHYPGGKEAFVAAMNRKAASLGLRDTRFYDSTGLNAGNVSSARDLSKMVAAAARYPNIREYSTSSSYDVLIRGKSVHFANTNGLVKTPGWNIQVSKTGYINESGKCLVMQASLNNRPTTIVLLDSWGKFTRVADAQRVKHWVESEHRTTQRTAQGATPQRG